jgi:thioredoxin reductase (NADPH)
VTGPASEATAYPGLDDSQQDRLRRYGTTRRVTAGEVMFSPADDHYDLLVVLSGEIVVSNESRGRDVELARHGPGQFAGELNLLTGQRPFLTARATAEGCVLALTPAQVREVLARETGIADILLRALIARRRRRVSGVSPGAAVEIVGTWQSGPALALRTFLNRNTIAYHWVDVDQPDQDADVLRSVGATREDLPVAITPTRVLMNADPAALAAALGLGRYQDRRRRYDVVVVGAGPAGLAAAVYGASEGLDVAVLDAVAPGGQAGSSSRIENYLGFPDGISGAELTTRAAIQAQRFGALLASPRPVDSLAVAEDGNFTVSLADSTSVSARAVVAASGARYRRLPLPNWERLEGAGIYYAATDLEARSSSTGDAFVLGGGNSAGQAALYLARRCARVTIVVRRDSLAASMSQYLIDRVTTSDRIDVAASTEVVVVDGGDHLESVALRNTATGVVTRIAASGLYCFIGAHPASAWLPAQVARDEDGFVLTDVAVPAWLAARTRLPYETAVDGIFAAGDIRAGSMKRVAAAAGEGSSVIRSVHQYLTEFSGDELTNGENAVA